MLIPFFYVNFALFGCKRLSRSEEETAKCLQTDKNGESHKNILSIDKLQLYMLSPNKKCIIELFFFNEISTQLPLNPIPRGWEAKLPLA